MSARTNGFTTCSLAAVWNALCNNPARSSLNHWRRRCCWMERRQTGLTTLYIAIGEQIRKRKVWHNRKSDLNYIKSDWPLFERDVGRSGYTRRHKRRPSRYSYSSSRCQTPCLLPSESLPYLKVPYLLPYLQYSGTKLKDFELGISLVKINPLYFM